MKPTRNGFSSKRMGQLMGVVLWSAHNHEGQWSQEYRMGCRARTLLESSSEIGPFLVSRWFDAFEPVAAGTQIEVPKQYSKEFSSELLKKYRSLETVSAKCLSGGIAGPEVAKTQEDAGLSRGSTTAPDSKAHVNDRGGIV